MKAYKPPYKYPKKIEWDIDSYTRYLLRLKIAGEPTFKRCFMPQCDMTNIIHERIHNKVDGDIASHIVIFIRGLQGVDVGTGSGKSSLGQELMMLYDDNPTTDKIFFSNDELLDQVNQIVKLDQKKHTFLVRDETPENLRRRSQIEVNTLVHASRQARLSFCFIKPEMESLSSASFVFEPMHFSKNRKYLKVAVYVEGPGYLGYLVMPLHLNSELWKKYQKHKEKYIQIVMDRRTNNFGHKELAQKFMATSQFQKCIGSNGKIVKIRIKKYLREVFPNITGDEGKYVNDTILEIMQEQEEGNYDQPDLNTTPANPSFNPPIEEEEAPPEPPEKPDPRKTHCPTCKKPTFTTSYAGKKTCIKCLNPR